ncbi:MAG: hemolytic protein HlpA [Firmicutes bacterium HGW-Firmicutes-8]|nr:MAG: hemolytic protein HlpA [Firmicutes bacterium HGW-Firmicutes-8]
MDAFDVPVVLFFFKRENKTVDVVKRIGEIKPRKLYLIQDGPRNPEEERKVLLCRKNVEDAISWPCEVIKNYADENKGVYDRIGLGAKWVFSKEETAIFLEDDNLPETTFFRFCKEMLYKYYKDTRVLWVCGTNYLEKYTPEDGSSYMFTQHMLPCGWASWSSKYVKYYDGNLDLLKNNVTLKRIRSTYRNKKMYEYDLERWFRERRFIETDKALTWDYQMGFTIRVHGLYGVVPTYNQIVNIGADMDSEHGGTSLDLVMTRRFCGIQSFPMSFPLVHPISVLPDPEFERKTEQIVIPPRMILFKVIRLLKIILRIPLYDSLTETLKFRVNKFFGENI